MKTLKSIPINQRSHYMKCKCGEYFNCQNNIRQSYNYYPVF